MSISSDLCHKKMLLESLTIPLNTVLFLSYHKCLMVAKYLCANMGGMLWCTISDMQILKNNLKKKRKRDYEE